MSMHGCKNEFITISPDSHGCDTFMNTFPCFHYLCNLDFRYESDVSKKEHRCLVRGMYDLLGSNDAFNLLTSSKGYVHS